MNLSTQERIDLIKSIAADGGEIVGEDELKAILESGEELFTYDGFEPSGQMHIAQGIIRAINTNKMIAAGFTFRMWVADWFGYLNNKMGGDLEKIKTVGSYFIEIWKASGMDLGHTEFLWTSDYTVKPEYWETVMKVAKSSTLKRVLRTTEIMGRTESDELSAAQIIYPCMQITDIFKVMKCQVTQLGLDQKKVNILAREVGPELGFWKPVIVSQGMLQGLQTPISKKVKVVKIFKLSSPEVESDPNYNVINPGSLYCEVKPGEFYHFKLLIRKKPNKEITIALADLRISKSEVVKLIMNKRSEKKLNTTFKLLKDTGDEITVEIETDLIDPTEKAISMKMSKSKPDTAIFMTDSSEDIERKIMGAYCPPGVIEDNPILKYVKQIIFQAKYLKGFENLLDGGFVIEKNEKNGWSDDKRYTKYSELESAYITGEVHPSDLKAAVIGYLNKLLQPVRDHFENDVNAKAILEQVKSFQVTR